MQSTLKQDQLNIKLILRFVSNRNRVREKEELVFHSMKCTFKMESKKKSVTIFEMFTKSVLIFNLTNLQSIRFVLKNYFLI